MSSQSTKVAETKLSLPEHVALGTHYCAAVRKQGGENNGFNGQDSSMHST